MTDVAMGGPDIHLPTQNRKFARGATELEPMRGHAIGAEPGILYHVAIDPALKHPITDEHAIVAIGLADDPLRPKS